MSFQFGPKLSSASKITLRLRKVIVDDNFISDNLIVVLLFGNSLLQVHCNPLYSSSTCTCT